jgi:hypothetical protein
MYRECFEVQALEEIPYRIQKQAKADTLLYVCHQPVSPSYLNKKRLIQRIRKMPSTGEFLVWLQVLTLAVGAASEQELAKKLKSDLVDLPFLVP